MAWVWESSRSEGIDRLVLLAIADSASDHGGDAWPSVGTLADKAKISVRTVQRAVVRLVELGELVVKVNAGKHGVNVYRVVMTPRPAVTPVTESPRQTDAPTESPPTPVTQSPDPRPSDTRTILEPSLPILKSISSEPATRSDVEAICTHLADRIEANGSKRPRITPRWRTAARLLLDHDGRTEQQVVKAIDWCQSDDFWRSNILSMPKLREKYDQLRLSAARASPDSKRSTTDDRVAQGLALAKQLRARETKGITDGHEAHAG